MSHYYRNSTAGDSPELMPLDSHIFSYLVEGIRCYVIATAHRENGQFKYKFGTPQEVKETMFAVWDADNVGGEGHVTSERIIRDIDRVRSSIITIIEHSGIVVHELDVRHGYRKDNLSENKMLSPTKHKRGCRSSWLQPEAYRVLNSAVLSAGEQLRPTGQLRGFTQLRPKSTNDTTDCG